MGPILYLAASRILPGGRCHAIRCCAASARFHRLRSELSRAACREHGCGRGVLMCRMTYSRLPRAGDAVQATPRLGAILIIAPQRSSSATPEGHACGSPLPGPCTGEGQKRTPSRDEPDDVRRSGAGNRKLQG